MEEEAKSIQDVLDKNNNEKIIQGHEKKKPEETKEEGDIVV